MPAQFGCPGQSCAVPAADLGLWGLWGPADSLGQAVPLLWGRRRLSMHSGRWHEISILNGPWQHQDICGKDYADINGSLGVLTSSWCV